MDPRFKKGCFVRFRGSEFELPSVDGLSVKLDTSKFMGKVTGSISSPDGVFYYVDVPIHGVIWNVKVSEDQIMTIPEYLESLLAESKKKFKFDPFGILPKTVVFGGGRDYGKSWLMDFEKWNEKIKSDRYSLKVDLGMVYPKMPESESKPESKMTKERCIKLLEAYRAEREKIAKGRKFERCLRACVVDEALEKAIELLKGGKS